MVWSMFIVHIAFNWIYKSSFILSRSHNYMTHTTHTNRHFSLFFQGTSECHAHTLMEYCSECRTFAKHFRKGWTFIQISRHVSNDATIISAQNVLVHTPTRTCAQNSKISISMKICWIHFAFDDAFKRENSYICYIILLLLLIWTHNDEQEPIYYYCLLPIAFVPPISNFKHTYIVHWRHVLKINSIKIKKKMWEDEINKRIIWKHVFSTRVFNFI